MRLSKGVRSWVGLARGRRCGTQRRTRGTRVLHEGELQTPKTKLQINSKLQWIDYGGGVKPVDLQQIGNELALKWDDGGESFINLETLRRACPCASCQGEVDVLGQLHKGPEKKLTPAAFALRSWTIVGGYGIQPTWGDGHGSGIYTFDYLRRLAGV